MATREPAGDEKECTSCASGLMHCHATVVVHADGTLACDQADICGADPALHDWWVPCTQLEPACGCTGDEQSPGQVLSRAA